MEPKVLAVLQGNTVFGCEGARPDDIGLLIATPDNDDAPMVYVHWNQVEKRPIVCNARRLIRNTALGLVVADDRLKIAVYYLRGYGYDTDIFNKELFRIWSSICHLVIPWLLR